MRDNRRMTTDEIREAFLRFFEQRDHRRLPSASLVPSSYDASVLLTTAGMHPLVPYFKGEEKPPHPRLASCQKGASSPRYHGPGQTGRSKHRTGSLMERMGGRRYRTAGGKTRRRPPE